MMKKYISLLLSIVLIFTVTACSGGSENSETGGLPAVSGNEQTDSASSGSDTHNDASAGSIDVDLTVLSSTMVYSEVYNMVSYPQDYIEKTVKMDGLFAYYHDEATGAYYYACIIQDATQCCAQGIEFVLTDEYVYPDDYPQPGDEICVIGKFDTYQEGKYTYCTLRNAQLV